MNTEIRIPVTMTERNYAYVAKDSSTLNFSNGFIIKGEYSTERLKKAVEKLYERHDALRMRVMMEGENVWFVKRDSVTYSLEIVPLISSDRESRYMEAMEDAHKRIREDALLSERGLYRFWAYELTDDELIFVYFAHHMATDAASMEILNEELELYYENPERTDIPETVSFEEFALEREAYYKTDEYKENSVYWKKNAECCEHEPLSFQPEDWKDDTVSMQIAEYIFPLDRLIRVSRENRTSNFNTMLLLLRIALIHITGKKNISISYLFNGRTNPKYARTVGFIAQGVDFSIEIPEELSFKEAEKMVRNHMNSGMKYISASDCIPLSEYSFSYMPKTNVKKFAKFAGMERQLFMVHPSSNYDFKMLAFIMTEMEGENEDVLYYYPMMNINIYGEEFAKAFAPLIDKYLEAVEKNPEIKIRELMDIE